jgi:hypothetical protein
LEFDILVGLCRDTTCRAPTAWCTHSDKRHTSKIDRTFRIVLTRSKATPSVLTRFCTKMGIARHRTAFCEFYNRLQALVHHGGNAPTI